MLSKIISVARTLMRRLRLKGIWSHRSKTAASDRVEDPGSAEPESPPVEPDSTTDTSPEEPPSPEDPPAPPSPEDSPPPEDDDDDSDESSETEEDETDEPTPDDPKPKDPRDLGGRRGQGNSRVTATDKPDPDPPPQSGLKPRLEFICRKPPGPSGWSVELSVPSDLNVTAVMQAEASLDASNGAYPIPSLTESLTIYEENCDTKDLKPFDGRPLVFKFRTDWSGDGRRVQAITNGHYIVIAPRDWRRTGHPPVEPEGCADPEFTAHYFYHGPDSAEAELGGFEEWTPELTRAKFSLEGNPLFDCHEGGDLFGGDVPELRCGSEVACARVGNEGDGAWRGENFDPSERKLADVLDGRQGAFYVRVYDSEATLLDSDAFRFAKNLKQILVNGEPYSETSLLVPRANGHPPAHVQFLNTDGTTARVRLETGPKQPTLKEDGTLEISRHPSGDDLRCALVDGDYRVDIAMLIPRVWWRLEKPDGPVDDWGDTPLPLSRSEFRRRATDGEVLRIRLPRCIASVQAGFGEDPDHRYRREDSVFRIPLQEFIDYEQITGFLSEDAPFNLRFGRSSAESISLPVMRLTADPVPEPTPEIVAFTATPATIYPDQAATLRWRTRNAAEASVRIEPDIGNVEPNGSVDVHPRSTESYTLRLEMPGVPDLAMEATCTIRVQTPDPVPEIVAFTATPAAIYPDQAATLRWRTRNAAEAYVRIEPDIGNVEPNGSVDVHPRSTESYTLRLEMPGVPDLAMEATCTIRVQTPDPVPEIVAFTATPAAIYPDQAATLRWRTRNAAEAYVRIEPDIGNVEPNGSVDVHPRSTESYTLRLEMPGVPDLAMEATCTIRVQTPDPVPEIVAFTATPAAIYPDQAATLRWRTRNAAEAYVRIEPDVGDVEPNGSVDVHPRSTESYTLRLEMPGVPDLAMEATCTIRVQARPRSRPRPQVVRTGGGWRRGRGFSPGEVRAGGFSRRAAASSAMRVDQRRKSTHGINVENLRRWNDARTC